MFNVSTIAQKTIKLNASTKSYILIAHKENVTYKGFYSYFDFLTIYSFPINSFNNLSISLINKVSLNDILTPLRHLYTLMNYFELIFCKNKLIKLYTCWIYPLIIIGINWFPFTWIYFILYLLNRNNFTKIIFE